MSDVLPAQRCLFAAAVAGPPRLGVRQHLVPHLLTPQPHGGSDSSPLGSGRLASLQLAVSRQLAPPVCALAAAPVADTECLGAERDSVGEEHGPLGYQRGFAAAYEMDRKLGSGAYGTVNMCIDRRSKREFACKVLPKVRGRLTPARTAKKIWQEVALLQRLQNCDNVAQLQAVYEDDTSVYIVLELCLGGDLEQLLQAQGALTERQAALVLHECLRMIADCHAAGMVHGDVKPANFLLKQRMRNPLALIETGRLDGWLKAIDFGCSQETRGAQLTRRTGTPVYMAPEVFQREYGTAADMWSLGMMLFQFLTCRFPFWSSLQECREKSLDQVMKAVTVGDMCLARLDLSPGAVDLLQGLLHRDPIQRTTAAEALEHPWLMSQLQQAPRQPAAAPQQQRSNIVPVASRPARRQTARPRRVTGVPASLTSSVASVGRSYPAGSWASGAAGCAY